MSGCESVGTISGLVDEARRDGVATQLARLAKQKKLGTPRRVMTVRILWTGW